MPPSTTEPPLVNTETLEDIYWLTSTVMSAGFTYTTSVNSTSFETVTQTVPDVYCPPPLTHYQDVCATAGGEFFETSSAAATTSTTDVNMSASAPVTSSTITNPFSTAATTAAVSATTRSATVASNNEGTNGRDGGAIGGAVAVCAMALALWML